MRSLRNATKTPNRSRQPQADLVGETPGRSGWGQPLRASHGLTQRGTVTIPSAVPATARSESSHHTKGPSP